MDHPEYAPYDVYGDLKWLLNFGPNRIFIYDYQGTFLVSGLIIGDTTIGGSSDWSFPSGGGGPFNAALNKGIEMATGAANMLAGFAGKRNYGVTKPQFKSPWQTVVDWAGSGTFSLNLSLLFMSLTPNEDSRKPVYRLLKCVYPEILGAGTMVVPPLEYTRVPMVTLFDSSNSGTWGCVGITIGDWFEAPPVFVVERASFSMSKEQTPNGAPLYANGEITVSCSHIVGINHIRQWLKLPVTEDDPVSMGIS